MIEKFLLRLFCCTLLMCARAAVAESPSAFAASGDTPVVFVLFDEFPASALVDRDDNVDALRFPNFSRLASESYWFKNATSVNQFTSVVVPAIVSGVFPTSIRRPPVASAYPRTLFTFLGASHAMEVYEPYTRLCPGRLCAHGARTRAFIAEQNRIDREVARRKKGWAAEEVAPEERIHRIRKYISAIPRPKRQTLYFMHNVLPHMPYQFMPSLRSYGPSSVPGYGGNVWTTNTSAIETAYHQFLLQVGAADTLLGKFFDKLRALGVYDRALVIVTADHGISFRPGDYRRGNVENPNFIEDLLYVPLFVKLPGQTEGVADYRNVESIDLLPTIADVLGMPLSWNVDGHRIFSNEELVRTMKDAYISRSPGARPGRADKNRPEGSRVSFDAPALPPRTTAAWKFDLPGYENPSPRDSFYLGPHPELIGLPAAALDSGQAAPFRFTLDSDLPLDSQKLHLISTPRANTCPCRVRAQVRPDGAAAFPSNEVAVAINGTIWGFAQLGAIRGHAGMMRFDITVAEAAFKRGANEVEIYFPRIDEA